MFLELPINLHPCHSEVDERRTFRISLSSIRCSLRSLVCHSRTFSSGDGPYIHRLIDFMVGYGLPCGRSIDSRWNDQSSGASMMIASGKASD